MEHDAQNWTPDKLRAHRLAAGLRHEDVAAILGVSPTTVRNWEAGKYVPTDVTLYQLSRWFEGRPTAMRLRGIVAGADDVPLDPSGSLDQKIREAVASEVARALAPIGPVGGLGEPQGTETAWNGRERSKPSAVKVEDSAQSQLRNNDRASTFASMVRSELQRVGTPDRVPMTEDWTTVTFRIGKADKAKLTKIAEQEGASEAEILRALVRAQAKISSLDVPQ